MSVRALCRFRRAHKVIDAFVEKNRSTIRGKSSRPLVIKMNDSNIENIEFVVYSQLNSKEGTCYATLLAKLREFRSGYGKVVIPFDQLHKSLSAVKFDLIIMTLPETIPSRFEANEERDKKWLSHVERIGIESHIIGIISSGDPNIIPMAQKLPNVIQARKIHFHGARWTDEQIKYWCLENYDQLQASFFIVTQNLIEIVRRVPHVKLTTGGRGIGSFVAFLQEVAVDPDLRGRLDHLHIILYDSHRMRGVPKSLGFKKLWKSDKKALEAWSVDSNSRWIIYKLNVRGRFIVLTHNKRSYHVHFFDELDRESLWNVVRSVLCSSNPVFAEMIQETFMDFPKLEDALKYAFSFAYSRYPPSAI